LIDGDSPGASSNPSSLYSPQALFLNGAFFSNGRRCLEMEHPKFFRDIEADAIQMGGGVKKGVISRKELEDAEEIRVSIRPPTFLGSIELFTLRNLKPGDYHVMLVAVPRDRHKE
jgi:hypothetical protein